MTGPCRIRLSRERGFRLDEVSRALNGRAAVNCARPSRWGNPYRVAAAVDTPHLKMPAVAAADAVQLYREALELRLGGRYRDALRRQLATLRGKNLACWCAPDAPCHADVLLELANGPMCEEVTAR